jgi:tetratricopeptide (TPR) repeat protein
VSSRFQIFVSYNHNDKDFVHRLAGDLRSRGITIWWDEWEIKAGDSIIERVSEGIDYSSYLAVVLSQNSITSRWVQHELNSALMRQLSADRNIKVLPLIIDDCSVPVFLSPIKWIDFRKGYEPGLNQILQAIGALSFPWINPVAEQYIQTARDAARAGDYNEAERLFQGILSKFPAYPAALSGLANVRFHQGRFQEGINCANKAINIDSQFPYAYYQRALCREAGGNRAAAIEDFKTALKLKPDFDYARNQLERILGPPSELSSEIEPEI